MIAAVAAIVMIYLSSVFIVDYWTANPINGYMSAREVKYNSTRMSHCINAYKISISNNRLKCPNCLTVFMSFIWMYMW